MTEFSEWEHEAARLIERSVEDAVLWLERAQSQLDATYGSQVQEWRDLTQAEHGCWCGPGNRCTEDKDAVDSCCHHHDSAYDALHIHADQMWTAPAFVATRAADRALVDCVSAAHIEDADSETRLYQAMLLEIFRKRYEVGDWLASL